MAHERMAVDTGDGHCPVHLFTPDAASVQPGAGPAGPWPAVILYMDALAIRPALFAMAQRMANGGPGGGPDRGYVVLLPDLFYRYGPYAPLVPREVFGSADPRAFYGPMMATTDNRKAAADTAAFLALIDRRADIAGTKVGVAGYCMGGGMALTVAGTWPDRIAAAASFHAGNLATDAELSPHRLAPRIKGRVYVAGADQDVHYPPEMADRLDRALGEAGVDHRCEIYAGARHGWTMTDVPVFDADAAERHWRELFALFEATLR